MANVRIIITARDNASGKISKADKALQKLSKQGVRASRSLNLSQGLNQAGAAMSRFGRVGQQVLGDAVNRFRSFEKGLANIKTLSGAATTSTAALSKTAKESAESFGQSAIDETAALYQIYSKTASDAATANQVLTASNKLAVAGQTDVLTATDGLTSVMNAYGLGIKDTDRIAASFFAAQDAGALTIGELSGNIGKVAGLAKAAGVGFEELNAGIATITLSGKGADEAATGLRGIFSALLGVKKGSAVQKEAKKFGIDFSVAGLKAAGGLKPFIESLGKAERRGKKLKLAKIFPNVRAQAAALDLLANSGENFEKTLRGQADGAEIARKAFATATSTKAFKLEKLESQLENLKIEMGEELIPTVVELAKELTPLLKSFAEFVKTNPKLSLGIVGVTTVLGPMLQAAASGIGIFEGLGVTMGDTTKVFSQMKTPIGKVAGTAGGKLGMFGLVVAAGAAGFAFGTFVDDEFGFSDKIAEWAGLLSGLNDEFDRLENRTIAKDEAGARKNLEADRKAAQDRIDSLETQQAVVGAVGIAGAIFTAGGSLVVGGAAEAALQTDLNEAKLALERANAGIAQIESGAFGRNVKDERIEVGVGSVEQGRALAASLGVAADFQRQTGGEQSLGIVIRVDQSGRVTGTEIDSQEGSVAASVDGGAQNGGP